MSVLKNQTSENLTNDFYLSATAPNTIPYATPLTFNTTSDGSTTGRIIGNLSSLIIQSDNTVTFSKTALVGGVQGQWNFNATVQNSGVGLYASSIIYSDTGLAAPTALIGAATISSINGYQQNPTAVRAGFFTQLAGGPGITTVANPAIQASSIILLQQFGPYAVGDGTSFSANPVPGIGFTSIANKTLSNALSMSYYVAKW